LAALGLPHAVTRPYGPPPAQPPLGPCPVQARRPASAIPAAAAATADANEINIDGEGSDEGDAAGYQGAENELRISDAGSGGEDSGSAGGGLWTLDREGEGQ